MTHEELMELMRGALQPHDEMERVCFDFVRAASRDPKAVPDDVYDRLKAHLTPPQILELACLVLLFLAALRLSVRSSGFVGR